MTVSFWPSPMNCSVANHASSWKSPITLSDPSNTVPPLLVSTPGNNPRARVRMTRLYCVSQS